MKLVITSNDKGSTKNKNDDLFTYVLRMSQIIYGQLLKMNLSLIQILYYYLQNICFTKFLEIVTCVRRMENDIL